MRYAIVLLMALLTSCSALQTKEQKIAASCAAATSALQLTAIGVVEGKISLQQRDEIVAAAEAIKPVCGAPNPPTLDSVKQAAFEQSVEILLYYAEKAR